MISREMLRPRPEFLPSVRSVQPVRIEAVEDRLELVDRDTRAVVVDNNLDILQMRRGTDRDDADGRGRRK